MAQYPCAGGLLQRAVGGGVGLRLILLIYRHGSDGTDRQLLLGYLVAYTILIREIKEQFSVLGQGGRGE